MTNIGGERDRLERRSSETRSREPDIISVLEAVYRVEQTRDHWFSGVLQAAFSALNYGRGVGLVLYDAARAALRVDAIDCVGPPNAWALDGLQLHQDPEGARLIAGAYRSVVSASSTEFMDKRALGERTLAGMARFDIGEQWMVNGMNPSGAGCALYLWSRARFELTASELTLLERLAVHLATGYRLQRRLAGVSDEHEPKIEAVLGPRGNVEHAERSAGHKRVRMELARAVTRREWARGQPRRDRQDAATAGWTGLVSARWTLVDSFENDGKHYILARQNPVSPPGRTALSAREREVAALAAFGRSNKLIAYELGIAHSTVRVLLRRAAGKLGVRTRAELLEKLRS